MNKTVEKALNHFCNSEDPVEFAFMITGDWGCGKTHFIKEYQKKRSELKFLHISLYGISTPSEIDDTIFQQLHPVFGSKSFKVLSRVGKGWLKAATKIDFDYGKQQGATSSISVNDAQLPVYLRNLEKYILVFDDLERCKIDIVTLLGYINYFVEFIGQKVILIANEKEIKSNDSKDVDNYETTKEKIVGKTLSIKPDLNSALEIFYKSKEMLVSRIELNFRDFDSIIQEVHSNSDYNNIRIVLRALSDFEYLWITLPKITKTNDNLIQKLFKIFLVLSLEVRKGAIAPADIRAFPEISNKNVANFVVHHGNPPEESDQLTPEEKATQSIFDKYQIDYRTDSVINFDGWAILFENNFQLTDEIHEKLEEHYANNSEPAWRKLWAGGTLADEEFEVIMKEVLTNFESRYYDDLGIVIHVALILLNYSDKGLCPKSSTEVLQIARDYIDSFEAKALYNRDFWISEYGLGYHGESSDTRTNEQTLFWEYLKTKQKDSQFQYGTHLLERSLTIDGADIHELCTLIGFEDQRISSEFVSLKTVSPEMVFEKITNSHNEEIVWTFEHALARRYERAENFELLGEELDWLKQFNSLMQSARDERIGKISGYNYSKIIDRIDDIILELKSLRRKE